MKQLKTVDCYQPALEFYQTLEGEFIPACVAGDATKAKSIVRTTLRQHFERHRSAIDKVVELAVEQCEKEEAEVGGLVASRSRWAITIAVLALASIGGISWYVAGDTIKPFRGFAMQLRSLSTVTLADVSQRLRENATNTSAQATMASGAAEQVSANAQSLATALEEFEASIKEIAGNASNAAHVARDAVNATQQTNATITRLGDSSVEIGKVIKVINSIAEQTNLLALNATIEAARAGEAGKGFAVVANEVKELAKETSRATEDIVRRIEAIQSDTQGAVDAIGLVSDIIGQINESQNAIAGAVEEQTAMTSEISRNISEVATGSGEIAKNISEVASVAQSTETGSNETMVTATDIEELANELLQLVGHSQTEPHSTEPARSSGAADETASSTTNIADNTDGLATSTSAMPHPPSSQQRGKYVLAE